MPEVRIDQTERGPALDNGRLRIEVRLNKGTFDVIDLAAGRTVLASAATSVSFRDGPTFRTRGDGLELTGSAETDDVHGRGVSLVLMRDTQEGEPEVSLYLTLYEDAPFAAIRAEVQNLGRAAVRVQSFQVIEGAALDVGAPAESLRFYKHGWQSWSPALVVDCAGEDPVMSPPVIGPGTQPAPKPGRFTSDLVTAIADPASGYGVVAGFVSAADQFSHLTFERDSASVAALSYADGIELAPKATLASERLYIEPANDPVRALERYGDALALEMEALPSTHVTSGWCSWYYYFQGVSEAEVIANLDYISANREALPFEYVQIDDGYQAEIGDWLTVNEKFPHGMKWLADEVHSRGFKAGLWVAPFLAGARSQLFREHPGWFTQFSTGGPAIATINWGQPCFALDLTHPEVIAWLEDTFRTICDEWGYDYVKIDFIFAAAVDGVRYDPNVTRAQAYRRGLEVIRDAVGNRFVLACGNPMGPSVGLVNGARIGPDVAPYWYPPGQAPRSNMSIPSAVNSIRNTISRFWMHQRLWVNDPDCLLVRETDTSLAGDEVRALAAAIGLTGGMVLDSDKLPKVSAERREIISLLLPVYGESGVPIDLFRTPDLPRLLELDCGTHRVLGVFNWADEPAEVEVPLPEGRWHTWELWEREYVGVREASLALRVPPHGCRVLRLTPDLGRPQVVGSTLHITMGAMEIAGEERNGERLRVMLRPVAKKDGELYVWRDGGVQAVRVEGLREERVIEV